MNQDYYSHWEWQPIENMPDGCNRVVLRTDSGETVEMCSCDFWHSYKEYKNLYSTFRIEE